jgi:RNA polymerase sigma-70 factor (ECF subfamily)
MGSDCALFERFRAGDRDAFTALYRAQQPVLYRFAFHMTADPVRAGELVQDVFVWLIHHPSAFDPRRGELGAFLVGVARNILHRYERQSRRWLPLESDDRASDAHDPSRAVEAADLRRAIGSLPVAYREAVVLCDLESKSYEEAAGLAGCAVGTIRSRLHRGRDLLARKLGVQ